MSMNKRTMSIIIIAIIIAAGVAAVLFQRNRDNHAALSPTATHDAVATDEQPTTPETPAAVAVSAVVAPITRPLERATLKNVGTYVTPRNSPVKPEKFTGFHTGTDFETFPEEAETDVVITAICEGPLLVKRTATGYGGVVVQRCEIDKQLVTVVYGHVRLSSITAEVGDTLKAGDKLGVLGTGFSTETDGERKHLHLSIHKGSSVDIAGYVTNKGRLNEWIDVMKYLR